MNCERLTNTLFPVPVDFGGGERDGAEKTGFGWKRGDRLMIGKLLRCGVKGDVARNISW